MDIDTSSTSSGIKSSSDAGTDDKKKYVTNDLLLFVFRFDFLHESTDKYDELDL